jgi:hypothetical protein
MPEQFDVGANRTGEIAGYTRRLILTNLHIPETPKSSSHLTEGSPPPKGAGVLPSTPIYQNI